MVGTSIGENLNKINYRVAEACRRSGREASSVRMLAVSKLHSVESIRSAYEAGQSDFAENYVQEALEKVNSEELQGLKINWHFIGRIQSNKVKQMNGPFVIVHSVDRLSVAQGLGSPGSPQDILLQYNVAGEATKGGAGEEELHKLLHSIRVSGLEGVRVCGLMVMPPLTTNPEEVRPMFARAREFLAELRAGLDLTDLRRHPLNELSMGTSQDFEVAVEEGATWIRVGSELFGLRSKK